MGLVLKLWLIIIALSVNAAYMYKPRPHRLWKRQYSYPVITGFPLVDSPEMGAMEKELMLALQKNMQEKVMAKFTMDMNKKVQQESKTPIKIMDTSTAIPPNSMEPNDVGIVSSQNDLSYLPASYDSAPVAVQPGQPVQSFQYPTSQESMQTMMMATPASVTSQPFYYSPYYGIYTDPHQLPPYNTDPNSDKAPQSTQPVSEGSPGNVRDKSAESKESPIARSDDWDAYRARRLNAENNEETSQGPRESRDLDDAKSNTKLGQAASETSTKFHYV